MTVDYTPAWKWIRERESIRVKKERGDPFPWTDDPILGTYRFCNVRREDDRVTRWIDEKIRRPYADHEYLWFMIAIARQINWPTTLAWLMHIGAWPDRPDFSIGALAVALHRWEASGQKTFTGAYIITAPPKKGDKKTEHVARVTLGNLWADREKFARRFAAEPKMRYVHEDLTKYNGWGPFLAYQAVVDMRFTPLLWNAKDIATWAAAGPGTIRGLNRLHGRALDYKLSQGAALLEILRMYAEVEEATGVEMDLSDVPNVLCEVDKYLRVANNEGKPRALYVPGRGS